MISVAKHMPGFKYDPAIGSFKAWLLNMTRWRITDQLRKRKSIAACQKLFDQNTADNVDLAGEVAQLHSDLDRVWDEEWEANLLQAAIAKAKRKLDPTQYQIFDLYVNKKWSPDRLAKTFSITPGQVYMAKHRVTEKIRQEVERLRKEIV
jgi:RNA polymerase sigma-70 factor (ECF subfamily)